MRVVERLREIGLPHAASKYEELAQLASEEKFSYEEFTLKLIEEENKERARRREEVLLRLSNFPDACATIEKPNSLSLTRSVTFLWIRRRQTFFFKL